MITTTARRNPMQAVAVGASVAARKVVPKVDLNCTLKERNMNGLIYLVGLVVVILAVLSFFGLR